MLRTNLWIDGSLPSVVLDHRSREARLQLQRIERLLVPRAAVTDSWLRRLLCPFLAPASIAAAARCGRAELAGR
jgi:hypothetical protein